MCDFFSAIIKRNGEIVHDPTNAHNLIVDSFNGKLHNNGCKQQYWEVEISPEFNKDNIPVLLK
jgi:hypothetical protein